MPDNRNRPKPVYEETPWNFYDKVSPDGKFKLVFTNAGEIGMSGPITADGTLEFLEDGTKILLSRDCGGPAVWSTDSQYVVVPVWPHRGKTVIAVFDTKSRLFRVDTKDRGLLRLKTFEGKLVGGTEHARDGEIPFSFDIGTLFGS